jgi:pimeloyl-ACP methyl ester carboxylesterase
MDALLTRRIDVVRPRLLEVVRADRDELAAISPHGHLASLNMPVFILHGSADNVIPPAESMWMEQDVPKADVRQVLVTGAFSHVDPSKNAPLQEQLRLVHFVAAVLSAAN